MCYYVSWKTTGYYRKDSLKLAACCPVSRCCLNCPDVLVKLFVILAIVCCIRYTMSGCGLLWAIGCFWLFKFFFEQVAFDVRIKDLLWSWSLWAWLVFCCFNLLITIRKYSSVFNAICDFFFLLLFLFVYEISREWLNRFAPNSQGRCVWSFT